MGRGVREGIRREGIGGRGEFECGYKVFERCNHFFTNLVRSLI